MKKLLVTIVAIAGLGLAPVAAAAPNPVTNPTTPCRFDGYLSVELFNPTYWRQDPHEVARTALEKLKAAVQKSL